MAVHTNRCTFFRSPSKIYPKSRHKSRCSKRMKISPKISQVLRRLLAQLYSIMWSWSKDKDFDTRTRLLLALLDNDRLYLDALNLALELPRYCAECDIGHGQAEIILGTALENLVNQLWIFRSSYQDRLNCLEKNVNAVVLVGDLFQTAICDTLFPLHEAYADAMPTMMRAYCTLDLAEPKFRRVSDKMISHKKAQAVAAVGSLAALLNLPLSNLRDRLNSWRKLFEMTPPQHLDHLPLKAAVERLGLFINGKLNISIVFGNSFQHTGHLLQLFSQKEVEVLDLHNVDTCWLKQGAVVKMSSKSQKKDRELILMENQLIVARLNGGTIFNGNAPTLTLKSGIPLLLLRLIDIPDKVTMTVIPPTPSGSLTSTDIRANSSVFNQLTSSISGNGGIFGVLASPMSARQSVVVTSPSQARVKLVERNLDNGKPGAFSLTSPAPLVQSIKSSSSSMPEPSSTSSGPVVTFQSPVSCGVSDSASPVPLVQPVLPCSIPTASLVTALRNMYSFQLYDAVKYITICFKTRVEKDEWWRAIETAQHRAQGGYRSPTMQRTHSFHQEPRNSISVHVPAGGSDTPSADLRTPRHLRGALLHNHSDSFSDEESLLDSPRVGRATIVGPATFKAPQDLSLNMTTPRLSATTVAATPSIMCMPSLSVRTPGLPDGDVNLAKETPNASRRTSLAGIPTVAPEISTVVSEAMLKKTFVAFSEQKSATHSMVVPVVSTLESKAVSIISTVNSTGLTSSTVSQFNTAGNICPTAGLVLPARQLSDPILLPQTAPFSAVVTLKATSSEVLQPIPRLPCVVAGCRVVTGYGVATAGQVSLEDIQFAVQNLCGTLQQLRPEFSSLNATSSTTPQQRLLWHQLMEDAARVRDRCGALAQLDTDATSRTAFVSQNVPSIVATKSLEVTSKHEESILGTNSRTVWMVLIVLVVAMLAILIQRMAF